jgi:hypothetical protein
MKGIMDEFLDSRQDKKILNGLPVVDGSEFSAFLEKKGYQIVTGTPSDVPAKKININENGNNTI